MGKHCDLRILTGIQSDLSKYAGRSRHSLFRIRKALAAVTRIEVQKESNIRGGRICGRRIRYYRQVRIRVDSNGIRKRQWSLLRRNKACEGNCRGRRNCPARQRRRYRKNSDLLVLETDHGNRVQRRINGKRSRHMNCCSGPDGSKRATTNFEELHSVRARTSNGDGSHSELRVDRNGTGVGQRAAQTIRKRPRNGRRIVLVVGKNRQVSDRRIVERGGGRTRARNRKR